MRHLFVAGTSVPPLSVSLSLGPTATQLEEFRKKKAMAEAAASSKPVIVPTAASDPVSVSSASPNVSTLSSDPQTSASNADSGLLEEAQREIASLRKEVYEHRKRATDAESARAKAEEAQKAAERAAKESERRENEPNATLIRLSASRNVKRSFCSNQSRLRVESRLKRTFYLLRALF